MKKNLEIKYKPGSLREIRFIKSLLKKYSLTSEKQTDIYYKTGKDRLKLRIINNTEGSLILYSRNEKNDKRISKYTISKTKDFRELDFILSKQFGVLVTVFKKREIYIHKNIRIHFDTVRGLGKFMEIEIIYDDIFKAKNIMNNLVSEFNLNANKFIKTSYSDLLINRR